MKPKSSRKRICQVVALMLLTQSSADATSLLDVWSVAQQYDPLYSQASYEQLAGQARRDQANSLWHPQVELSAGTGVVNTNSSITGAQFSAPAMGAVSPFNNATFNTSVNGGFASRYALTAIQPVYNKERSAQSRQLNLSADAADIAKIASAQNLMMRVTELYLNTVAAEEILQLLKVNQEAIKRTYQEIQKRVTLGDASNMDLQEAAVRFESMKSKMIEAELGVQINLLALNDLTGQYVQINRINKNFNFLSINFGELNTWIIKQQSQSPQLLILALKERIAREEVEKYASMNSPTFDFIAQSSSDHVSGSGDYGAVSNTTNNNMIGMKLTIPLYTGGYRSSKYEESIHLADKSKAELDQATLAAQQQLSTIWLSLQAAQSRIATLSLAVKLGQERLFATQKSHRTGARSTLELLGAESDLVNSEITLLQAQVELLVNRVRLSVIAGDASEKDLQIVGESLKTYNVPK